MHAYAFHDRYVSKQLGVRECHPHAAVAADRAIAFDFDYARLAAEELPDNVRELVAARLLRACQYKAGQEKQCAHLLFGPGVAESDESDYEVLGEHHPDPEVRGYT